MAAEFSHGWVTPLGVGLQRECLCQNCMCMVFISLDAARMQRAVHLLSRRDLQANVPGALHEATTDFSGVGIDTKVAETCRAET